MTESWDVVIVGGAVMGASSAYWLTRLSPGLRVLVVEMDPTYARSATALSVASVRQQFSNPVNVAVSRFGVAFIRDFQQALGHDVGIASLGLKENGYLFLTGDASGRARLERLAAMQRDEGAATEVLTPEQITARFPWLSVEDVTAGAFGPRDEGWFDNMGLLNGFRAAARAQGAEFLKDRVTGLEKQAGRVTGVTLASGRRVSAGAVINAAGTRGAEVMRMLGEHLPVEPRKRTVFLIDAPNARHPDGPLLIDHTGFYMRPEHGQWIIATVPNDDAAVDPEDFTPDADQFDEIIWPLVYARAPGFDAVKVQRYWVGHYDYNTLDQNAVVGRWPGFENLYLLNGFSGHGLQQSPAMGRGIAELILHGAYQSLDLGALGAERLMTNTPFLEEAIV
ncbi:MAG: FAD-binding oxidoreductase [Paracoccaceae bacterium]|nr:FAD-binding oxidoreductase [Paracoccaceae bacterium]MDE3239414.1 FAD-binding oxidoreductase [Paracoccaceae bacterium]